jgi:hypothetical protein
MVGEIDGPKAKGEIVDGQGESNGRGRSTTITTITVCVGVIHLIDSNCTISPISSTYQNQQHMWKKRKKERGTENVQ